MFPCAKTANNKKVIPYSKISKLGLILNQFSLFVKYLNVIIQSLRIKGMLNLGQSVVLLKVSFFL